MPSRRLPADIPNVRFRNALQRLGFVLVREGKHSVYGRGTDMLPVPRHPKLRRDTILRALARLGITEEELMEHY